MEKFYTIKGKYAEVILDKDIYPLVSIKKALSNPLLNLQATNTTMVLQKQLKLKLINK